MSVTAEFKGDAGHLFNKIKWMYISTSDKGCKYSKHHGKGDDEVVIEGESVIMMDTIPIKDETTMKIMKSYEHGDFNRVRYEAIKNGKTYHTGVNNE
jgi:hypothetical protein